ncbi:unnamed protein product [Eruca vesicaria subsp. sativa]|uniref:Uncharacterized protein n=1 Tax=Eruca vesicaria subsp. sativa TaxID=29727 RepID=A0ABC8KG23_ERUVS|nr:unnamed protein product [Eruca vesicaria subsp. sativa]
MTTVAVDDTFKRQGSIPFSWEIRPGVPKTQVSQPENAPFLQPPKKLSPLRLKPRSHSQPLLPPALSPPSSSFISKSRSSPVTPSFPTPSKLKPPPPSQSRLYSPTPSFRSTPRAFSERWRLNRVRPGSESEPRPGSESKPKEDFGFAGLGCFPTPKFRLRKKSKTGGLRKIRSDRDYCYDMETMSPWTVSPRWDSPKSSFSSLRFSPRLANEAEWVGLGLF